MSDVDHCDWISSREARAIITARTGRKDLASRLLYQELFEGTLKARADSFAEQINFGPLPQRLPLNTDEHTSRVRTFPPTQYATLFFSWNNDGQNEAHPSWMVDWKFGTFAVVNPPVQVLFGSNAKGERTTPVGRRIVFFNVEFIRSEIIRFSRTIPFSKQVLGTRKPQRKKWNFAPVLAKLETWIQNNEMEKHFGSIDNRGAKAKIEGHLKLMLSGDGEVPPSTLERRAKKLMHQWRKHLVQKSDGPI